MYEVLDRDTMPGGRSIWIIDMKGEPLSNIRELSIVLPYS